MAWTQRYEQESIAAVEPHLVSEWSRRIESTGLADRLHDFARADLAQDMAKRRLLVAYNMGLGKTRLAIIAAASLGERSRTVIVVPNKLVGEWQREFAALGIADQAQVITSRSQIDGYRCPAGHGDIDAFQPVTDPSGAIIDVLRTCPDCGARAEHVDRLARYNLISMRSLWTIPKDSPHAGREKKAERRDPATGRVTAEERNRLKHTFAWLLRNRTQFVIIDEAYNLSNPDSLQTRAVFLLKPRRRWLLTGTPVRGYPENILALLNWCLGTGSDLFPAYDSTKASSAQRFRDTFATKVVKRRADGTTYDRYVPRISNPERFQTMLAPVMRRRVNLEPEVAAAIRMPRFVIVPEQIELDANLRGIYERCVTDFAGWWRSVQAQAAATNTPLPQATLLAKLTWLARLAAVPQRAVEDYGGISAKQTRIIDIIREARERGQKVILFSEFSESVEWYASLPLLASMKPTVVTGSVSLARGKRTGTSERERRLAAFREGDSRLLVATTACMAEGLNLPEASVVIFDSYPWVPAVQAQAWSRVLRPAQTADPVMIHLVSSLGTIDDYLSAICAIKRAAINEGIDHEAVEIDLDDVPDPHVYANSLVEQSGNVAATFGALAWIERLKAQAGLVAARS